MAVTVNPVCTAYPTVLNGKTVDKGAEFAEYECLSGFYMTGNKRITCNPNTGLWDESPTCSVIDNSDKVTVYPAEAAMPSIRIKTMVTTAAARAVGGPGNETPTPSLPVLKSGKDIRETQSTLLSSR
nr:hypothetical protein BaRGS_034758 [Batillaria attramentaria]